MTTVKDIELVLEQPIIVAEHICVVEGQEYIVKMTFIPLYGVFRVIDNEQVLISGRYLPSAIQWFNGIVGHYYKQDDTE